MASMFRFTAGKYRDTSDKLVKQVRKSGLIALRILGFNVMQDAQKSIKSVPGERKWIPLKASERKEEVRDKTGKLLHRAKTGFWAWVFPASPPGTPPYTHPYSKKKRKTEGGLPGAILYDTEKDPDAVVIGPSAELFSKVGKPHEHAGGFRGANYPERPFMGPALSRQIGSLPGLIAEQINKNVNA